MHRFANPTRLLGLISAIKPWAAGLCLRHLPPACILFLASPPDYQQSETQLCMSTFQQPDGHIGYSALAVASASALIWRHLVADMVARATALQGQRLPPGARYGSLWGKPMWGTWWVWDARLTSVLISFFCIWDTLCCMTPLMTPPGGRAASIRVGTTAPIIKFSVDWWNTLHQPASVVKLDGPAIHMSMLTPLLLWPSPTRRFIFGSLPFVSEPK